MKNSFRIIIAILAITFFSGNVTTDAAGNKHSKDRKNAEQAIVRKSVESGRFIIRLDRIYFRYGGIADLKPRANYIILDRGSAVISTAYLGRQFDIRPIAGINMIGRASVSEIKRNPSKGSYIVKMKVDNGNQTLNVTLRIGSTGSCDASISGLMIDNVTYSGDLVPVKDNRDIPPTGGEMI